jgi:hypothetical protein
MQISGVSLALTWPLRLCLLRVLLGATATATSFPLSKHTGGGDATPAFSGWPTPLSCGVFLPPPLLQTFLLLAAEQVPLLLPSPAGLFIYSSVGDFPSPPLWHSRHLALFAMCLFCCLLFSFSFFPGWGLVCPGAMQYGPGLFVGVPRAT